MYEPIHEKIAVAATFEPGSRPRIHQFVWQNRTYKIIRTTMVNKARRGRESVWLFHVTTETMAFKIRLDTDSLIWWLEELTWDEAEDN